MSNKMTIIEVLIMAISISYMSECKEPEGVGYRIGNVSEYKLLRTYGKSKLY
jgi:hypothetical protein